MQRALVVAKEFVQFVGWAHGRRPLRSLGVARPILVRVGLIRVVVDLDTRMVVYVFYGARAHRDAQTAVPALRRHACASVNGQWLGRDDGCVFYSGGVKQFFVDMALKHASDAFTSLYQYTLHENTHMHVWAPSRAFVCT